jgi:hypothetical protein
MQYGMFLLIVDKYSVLALDYVSILMSATALYMAVAACISI